MKTKSPIVKVDWTGRMEVYSSSDYLPIRALAHRLKDGDKDGITKAAAIMADLVKEVPDYQHSVLVPMPGRKGSAGYTKVLADEIAGLLGLEVSDMLTVKPHKPLYDRKAKKGIDGLKPFKFIVNDQIPEKPILIDNVLDTGTTAMSAFRALDGRASLVVLGSTVNYRQYNYPITVNMKEAEKPDPRTLEELKDEVKKAVCDALFVKGSGLYDAGDIKAVQYAHDKTLSGKLKTPVPISDGQSVVRIGLTRQGFSKKDMPILYTQDGGILVEQMTNRQDLDAILHELRNTYYNEYGNILSTFGRHTFKEGESFQMKGANYKVLETGTFMSLMKPFGGEGVKVADDMGKTKVLMASSHLSTVIYVQPHSQRLHDAMMQRYGQDIRGPIKEALEKALKTDKVQQESVQKNKEMIKEKNSQEQAAREEQKKKDELRRQEALKEKDRKLQEKRKQEEQKQVAKKEPHLKVPGAVAQALLLSAVLETAKANGGVWLNASQKKAPGIFKETTQLSPYNVMLLSAHSDVNGFKTSQYLSFDKARTQGLPVMQGQEGVPLSWTKWDLYVNKYDKTDVKNHEAYLQVPAEERPNYQAVPKKEYRYMFNVEQTVFPSKSAKDFEKLVDSYGSQDGAKVIDMNQKEESSIASTYNSLKAKHPDAILLFRNNDSYNTYNQDAETSSSKLGITLTSPKDMKGIDHLASFPHHQLDVYLPKLVRAGLRVAIVDEPLKNDIKTSKMQESKQEKEAADRMKVLVEQLNKRLVPVKSASSLERTHYDATRDAVLVAPQESYDNYTDYAHDMAVALVAATGSESRLNRQVRSAIQPENAEKYERLVQELSAGAIVSGLGLQARLSPENMNHIDYWSRELKEDTKLMGKLERDVNTVLESIDKLTKGETVDFAPLRGEKPMEIEMPMNYSISRELAKLPSAERKEFVVITDKSAKSAEVILPAGASMKVNNEIPGMNKSRIATALKKEGVDGDSITFYNAGGALGLHQPNGHFEGKDIMVDRLKQYNLIPVTRLDVSTLVAQKAEIEKVNLFPDKDNNYAIFIKPKGEQAITMYPAKEDVTTFFKSLKEPKGDAIRGDLGQKYYQLSHEHPELKKDLLTIDTGDVDLSRISNVNLYKSDTKAGIFMTATIDGKKQESREVSKADWNRFWLVEDQNQFKTQLATKIYDNVLHETRKEEAEPEVRQANVFRM